MMQIIVDQLKNGNKSEKLSPKNWQFCPSAALKGLSPKKRRRCVCSSGRNRGNSSDALISYAVGPVVPAVVFS